MDIDAIKAPRTHAAWKKAYDVKELAKFMAELSQQLEVELNIAIVNEAFAENKVYMLEKQLKQANEHLNESNKIIRQQQLLDEENLMLKNRIKRLEYAGGLALGYAAKGDFESADEVWLKAKEAKL
jgi:hypothetical protein